ncbi:MAG TPA: ankyrin repeat domain-containing protein, partial [Phenylobacterium sp.]|nr:ankyrin repeat domain-containing protein [Phenylobacterium sp.]
AVKAALAAGVDVNAPSGDGTTALHWAAYRNDLAIADLLIGKGAKVNAATDLGVTPLWIAASNSSTPMVERLLAARADPNLAPATDGTPLMIAARRGNAPAVKALLAQGADPNAREASHSQTALMWAASERHADVVGLLLAAKADVRARTKSWTQRVMMCCQLYQGDFDGAAIIPKGGFTPLLFAAQAGDVESARRILAAGADVNDASPDGASALVIALHAGQKDMAAFLIDAGADVRSAGAGYTALHLAAARGDLNIVQALLAHGADLNARQTKGSPTKQFPSGHALDHTMTGATPFMLAAWAGQLDVMRALVAKGADPKIPLADGRTALMMLASRTTQTLHGPNLPDARIAEALKVAAQLGAPVNVAGPGGDTALHIAAERRRDLIVQALADSGAALNLQNREGKTPLAVALTPPPPGKGSGRSNDYEYLLTHTATAELLRKLGAKG